jgi:hypothetical protein
MRFSLLFTLLFLPFTDTYAQRCKVREKYSPVSDTTSWVFGRKDFVQIYVDKTDEREAFILLSIITLEHTYLMTSVEDSVVFLLNNGQPIKLANYKNMMPKHVKIFALTGWIELGYLVYLLPVTHDELRQLSESKIKSFSVTVQTAINLYTGNLDLKKRMLVKCKKITKSSEKIHIDFNGIDRDRNLMIRSATCALKYLN